MATLFTLDPIVVQTDVFLLPAFAKPAQIQPLVDQIAALAHFRHLTVPGGKKMSVAMTNCGTYGWASDHSGYRYCATDPLTNQAWPAMPAELLSLANSASALVGFNEFNPDACLINQYRSGARMGLHQDRDEKDLSQPIVSVSLGDSCKFIVGGLSRSDPQRSITLNDGDVLVWGRSARLLFHGVRSMPKLETILRYNLTFRRSN